jgi:hypothetical protein
MGRDGYFWSVEECRWLPCPQPVVPEQAASEPTVAAEADAT